MINGELCVKYAKALLDIAKDEERIEKTAVDLSLFINIIKKQPQILFFLKHPGVLRDEKNKLLENIIENSWFCPFAADFLRLLGKKGHIEHIEGIYGIYQDLSLMLEKKIEVNVESAFVLGKETKELLQKKLSSIYGKDVHMRLKTSPDLVGGIKVRVGDTVYDLSLKRQLERLRERMA